VPSRVSFHSRPLAALLYPSSSADAGAGATAAVTAEQRQRIGLSHLAYSLLCCMAAAGVPVKTQAPLCRPQEHMATDMGLAIHSKRSVTAPNKHLLPDVPSLALCHLWVCSIDGLMCLWSHLRHLPYRAPADSRARRSSSGTSDRGCGDGLLLAVQNVRGVGAAFAMQRLRRCLSAGPVAMTCQMLHA
jgi:hypothetical protein